MKKIKKIVASFVKNGITKEKIKLFYYNIFSQKGLQFFIEDYKNSIYKTVSNNFVIYSKSPLYFVALDFDYYTHFYKLKNGDVIIDAGANEGYLSIFFSKLAGNLGKVYAFEPDSYNIKKINENLDLNKDCVNSVFIEDKLLWNSDELVDFCESGTVGSSAIWISDQSKVVKKQAITIDSWVKQNNLSKLDFIKMDIEGAEIEALDGCIETIAKFKPNFAIASYHIVDGKPTYIAVEAFFKKINYPYKTITHNKFEIITYAGEL